MKIKGQWCQVYSKLIIELDNIIDGEIVINLEYVLSEVEKKNNLVIVDRDINETKVLVTKSKDVCKMCLKMEQNGRRKFQS